MKTVVQKVTTWVNSHYTQKGKLLLISMVFSVLLSLDANNNNGYYIACLTLVFLSISHVLAYFYSTPLEIKRDSIKRFICGQKNSYYITIKNPTNKAIYNLKLIDEYQYTHPDDLSESKAFDFKKSDRFLPSKTHFVKGIVPCLPARSERKAKMSIIPEGRGIIDFRSHKALRPEPMDLCYNITKIKLNYSTLSEPRLLSIASLKKRIPKSDTFVSQSLMRKPTLQGELRGLKPYSPGDNLKRIHWKTFIKTDSLLVKEFEEDEEQSYVFIIDNDSMSERAVIEESVSVVWSLIHYLLQNSATGIKLFCSKDVFYPDQHNNKVEKIGEFLSLLRADAGSSICREVQDLKLEKFPPQVIFAAMSNNDDQRIESLKTLKTKFREKELILLRNKFAIFPSGVLDRAKVMEWRFD